MRFLITTFAAAALLAHAPAASAQRPILARIDHLAPHQTRVDVFSLQTPQDIDIDATGADERFPRHGKLAFLDRAFGSFESNTTDPWRGNAWIIDAATRNVVWELRNARSDKESNGIHQFKGSIHLPAGTYEAYYAAYSAFTSTFDPKPTGASNVNTTLTHEQILAHTKYDDDGISKQFALTIRGAGRALPSTAYFQDVDVLRTNAFISLTGLKSNSTRSMGFALDRPARIDVYAIGEVRQDETFDYGWIINADTHEKVWGLDYRDSRAAGGAAKNREAHTVLDLPAGRYAAIYTLDESHDASDWNESPPHDPGLWGMTLRSADAADRSHIRTFAWDDKPSNAIVAMTGIGDDQMKSQGFTLKRPMQVRVLALGEGSAESMSDFGWITDAKSHRRVWTMKYEKTQHAGGSAKNRIASEVVQLDPGSYIVNYRTDGSHSAQGWNSGAPIEGDLWGITVSPVNASERSAAVAYDADAEEAGVIAKLTNMEDNEDARATFHLDRTSQVHVYAIGEGRDNAMFDRGYIEERGTKRIVWDMKYRETQPAGGAVKNRMFDGTVSLPAGDYVLRWVSDDSHSAAEWNEPAPEDPAHWGITIYRADGK